jgi:hypothetical protein
VVIRSKLLLRSEVFLFIEHAESMSLITAKVTVDLIPARNRKLAHELGWGDIAMVTTKAGAARVKAFEVRHWGARGGEIGTAVTTATSSNAMDGGSFSGEIRRTHTALWDCGKRNVALCR